MNDRDGIQNRILREVESFPSMPGSAPRLMELLDKEDVSAAEIESVVACDPGLTANILRLSNSAYFGFARKIASIRQAIVVLGMRQLRKMVLASCTNAFMHSEVPGYQLSAGELLRHSVAVTVISEGLVKELGLTVSDELFTAGLLHDIGKLVMGKYIAEKIDLISERTGAGHSFDEAVQEIIGIDHAEVGAMILANWSLPDSLIHTVRYHHDPEAAGTSDTILDVVHVANNLCVMIGIGVGRDGLLHKPSLAAARRLGIRPDWMEHVASQAMQWIEELAEVFISE